MRSSVIERRVQVTVGCMVALGAAMLDASQDQRTFSLTVIPLVVISHVVTDRKQWFHIPRAIVALTSLGAIGFFYSQFNVDSSVRQLHTIGNLLMAWSSLTLLQQKAERVYGSLAVFSLLAVVVAAVLNIGLLYIVLLTLYIFFAAHAMCALHLFRVEQRQWAVATGGEVISRGIRSQSHDELAEEEAVYAYQPFHSEMVVEGLSRVGRRQTMSVVILAAAFAFLYFYTVPRTGRTNWQKSADATVGFANEISFEEMGEILENDDLAMRIAFFDTATNEPYEVFGDIYVYGKPLVHYRAKSRKWVGYPAFRRELVRLPFFESSDETEVVRLDVSLEPTIDEARFGIFPMGFTNVGVLSDRIRWTMSRKQLVTTRHVQTAEGSLPDRYAITTAAFSNGAQSPLVPAQEYWPSRRSRPDLSPGHLDQLLDIDRTQLPGLVETAAQIRRGMRPDANKIQIARAMQDYFAGGDYVYTLDFSNVRRDSRLDPVEDFVVNHKSGHCEYYASALTLMLRSQGIPARVMVGYRGGDFNPVGKYYQFYQRDAHAWVEVYLAPDEVPDNSYTQYFLGRSGAWYRLDPTPSLEANSGIRRTQLDQWVDYAQYVWNDYVVDLNPEKQQADVYNPFAQNRGVTVGREWLEDANDSMEEFVSTRKSDVTSVTRRFGAVGQAILLITAVALVGIIGGVPFLAFRWLNRRGRRAKSGEAQQSVVAFYQRLEQLLRRAGITRQPHQTQREFAKAVPLRLVDKYGSVSPGVSSIPAKIVDWFYDVRFGARELEVAVLQEIEGDLATLEEWIETRRR